MVGLADASVATNPPGRDQGQQHTLPSLEEFRKNTAITQNVTSLNRFEFTVIYQNDQLITGREAILAIAPEGLRAINEVLKEAWIFQLHHVNLELQSFKEGQIDGQKALISYSFDHDRLHCQFIIYSNCFKIVRQDSSFENFYEWYRRIMPRAAQTELIIRRLIEKASGQRVEVVQSIFEFTLNFGDFETRAIVAGSPRGRNVDVLRAIIPSLPDEKGDMREIPDQDFYRIDLTLSRLERFSNNKERNAWYFVEAPANEYGRYLVLKAQLRNASTEQPGTDFNRIADVSPFDPDFGDDYRLALNEFLRDRALEGFARRFLGNWNFVTPRTF